MRESSTFMGFQNASLEDVLIRTTYKKRCSDKTLEIFLGPISLLNCP
jgi:hypothetical protein